MNHDTILASDFTPSPDGPRVSFEEPKNGKSTQTTWKNTNGTSATLNDNVSSPNSSISSWFRKTFQKVDKWLRSPEHAGSPWFYGCMCDLVLFVSNTQAAGEHGWLVDSAADDFNLGPKVYVNTWQMILLFVGVGCGVVKWILIALRSTNRAVRFGTEVTIASVFAQLILTSIVVGAFRTDTTGIAPPESGGGWIASAAYIAAYITIIFACLSIPLHLIDWLWLQCPNRYVSKPKRDMTLASVVTMAYYLIGAAIYSAIEGWNFNDAFFFVIVYLTTIGYGHIAPQTVGGKVFTIIYGIMGIAFTINYLLSIRAVLIEWTELWVRPPVEDYVRKRRQELSQNKQKRKAAKATKTMLSTTTSLNNSIMSRKWETSPVPLPVDANGTVTSNNNGTISGTINSIQVPLTDTDDTNFQYLAKEEGKDHVHYTTREGLPDLRITTSTDKVDPEIFTAPLLPLSPTSSPKSPISSSPIGTVSPTTPTGILVTKPPSPQLDGRPSSPGVLGPRPVSPRGISFADKRPTPPLPSSTEIVPEESIHSRPSQDESMPDLSHIHDYSLENLPPGFTSAATGSTIRERSFTMKRSNTVDSKILRRSMAPLESEGMERYRRRSMWWVEPREQLEDEEMIQKWTDRIIALSMIILFLAYWFLGALIFDLMEPQWGYLEAVYFCWITISTTGFGDYVPTYPSAWMFWTYYNLLMIAMWAYALTVIGNLLQSQAGVLFQWHATTLPAPTSDVDNVDEELVDGDVGGHYSTYKLPNNSHDFASV